MGEGKASIKEGEVIGFCMCQWEPSLIAENTTKDGKPSLKEMVEKIKKKSKQKSRLWGEAMEEVEASGLKEGDSGFLDAIKERYNEKIKGL